MAPSFLYFHVPKLMRPYRTGEGIRSDSPKIRMALQEFMGLTRKCWLS